MASSVIWSKFQGQIAPQNSFIYIKLIVSIPTAPLIFRASFVHLTRRRAASLFSYAKPNKQVRVFTATSFDGYEPEGRAVL